MKLLLPEDKKLIHTMQIQLRWGDMDAYRHINNTLYFRYFESARVEWLHGLDIWQNPDEVPVVVNAFSNFYAQLTYPGDVIVKSYTSNVGRSSFDCWYELRRVDEPELLYCDGGATTVWTDKNLKKSAALPDALRAAIS